MINTIISWIAVLAVLFAAVVVSLGWQSIYLKLEELRSAFTRRWAKQNYVARHSYRATSWAWLR